MTRIIRGAKLLPVGLLALVSACGCNLVGCLNGLTVTLAPAPPDGVLRVEARVLGSPSTYVFECPANAQCGGAFFSDFTPSRAVLTITTSRGTVEREVRPTYTTTRPNGKGCDPQCVQGAVTVAGPA